MDRRATARQVGTEVSKAIAAAGESPAVIAEAIGLTGAEMDQRLAGAKPFTIPQLVRVGGLLRVHASEFLRSVA